MLKYYDFERRALCFRKITLAVVPFGTRQRKTTTTQEAKAVIKAQIRQE